MDVKPELKNGFWMAFALFCWWTVEYLFGLHSAFIDHLQKSILISNVIVPIVGLWLLLTQKKVSEGGTSTYGSLAISGGISIVASSIFILALSIVFYKLINPGWVDFMVQKNIELTGEGKTPEELAKLKEGYSAVFAAGSMGMQNFSRFIMFGLLILLLEALVVLKLPQSK